MMFKLHHFYCQLKIQLFCVYNLEFREVLLLFLYIVIAVFDLPKIFKMKKTEACEIYLP